MILDVDLAIKIVVPLITLALGKYLDQWLTKRPKLISYLGHASSFTLRSENPTTIHTHAIVVQNAGKVAINNLRIGHCVLPENFQLTPSIPHSIENTPGNIAEIIIPKLVPEEQITISYLYFPPLLWNQIHAYTKSDEGFAKIVTLLPAPQISKWASRMAWVLVLVGTATLLYLIVILLKQLKHFVS